MGHWPEWVRDKCKTNKSYDLSHVAYVKQFYDS